MEALLPYLPTDRRHALASGIELPGRTRGAAMFVDISGFTPLAEVLAKDLGSRRGAEELTAILNQVYDVLITELDHHRGSVIGFSGDAITCWFEADGGPAAAACALKIQANMAQFSALTLPSGETVPLAAKAGIAVGEARRFAVGDVARIDVLAGRLLDEMAEAEHHASRGEVVLGPSAVTALADQAETLRPASENDDFAVLSSLRSGFVPRPWPELGSAALTEDQLRPWLHGPVYERLRSGQGEFLAELRPAVALFLAFEGLDYDDDEDAGSKLDAFVRRAQAILAKYDGILVDITTGDKGSHLYAAFGAPTAHEDDLERAASAALDLRTEAANHSDVTAVAIGISRGRMRTGAYGGRTRRTYGVLGDATNLAARLMQAAGPGEILVSQDAAQRIRSAFTWSERSAIPVKGKAEPVLIMELVARRTGQRRARTQLLPMVGRVAELEAIQHKLDQARRGSGQIIGISAPAGMGKSRLLAEVVYSSITRGLTVYRGECKSYGTSSAYLPWESIWREFFGISPSLLPEAQIHSLHAWFQRGSPGLLPRLPLLGAVLNLTIPDNELTRSFDAKLRKTSLESLLVDLVRGRAQHGLQIFVLEDTHWIDPLSLDLLDTLARAAATQPVAILLAYRTPEEGAEPLPVSALPHFTQVMLADLSAEEAQQWISLKLAQLYGPGSRASTAFTRRLFERAEGNPFYIEEVLNYLRDHSIAPDDEAALAQIELPASLHSLVLTRIDQLPDRPRSALRVASVVGRAFKAAELMAAHPPLGNPEATAGDLATLERKGFAELADPSQIAYKFKHSVIQEVAYESLPYATRAGLHENLGGYLERAHADSLDQYLGVLAYHFERTTNDPKKREYFLKAGKAAQHNYANSAALEYYRKLLPLLADAERIEIDLKTAQVLELLGEWGETERVLQRALETSETLDLQEPKARAQTALGECHRKQGAYPEATAWLDMARSTFEELGDQGGRAQVLHFSGTLAAQQGEYDAAVGLYEDSLAIRQQLNDQKGIASLLSNLGIIARFKGDLQRALSLNEQGLQIRRTLGDRWAIANSLNNQGALQVDLGDYSGARDQLDEAVSLLREIGDRWHYANAVHNLANARRGAGDYGQARQLYRESLEINRELGDGWALAYLLEDFAGLNAIQSHAESALKLAGAAMSLRESIGAPLPPLEQENLDRLLEPALKALTPEARDAASQAGQGMTLDEALDFARADSNAAKS